MSCIEEILNSLIIQNNFETILKSNIKYKV